ncbi:hypothetical protein GOBAR_AA27536 [Gossypium barbadense]|uniref:Uncharacterized protein n=1 Tax=Gossypium barbadense TaxID=3634 RepID=A0A2P5WPX9_GOSBA|nr:hypothetical protein GOBAR_AA27536 [Gossypium barbadense]
MDHQQLHGIQNNNPLFLGFNHAVHLHCPYPWHSETCRNSDPSPPQGNSPLQVIPILGRGTQDIRWQCEIQVADEYDDLTKLLMGMSTQQVNIRITSVVTRHMGEAYGQNSGVAFAQRRKVYEKNHRLIPLPLALTAQNYMESEVFSCRITTVG